LFIIMQQVQPAFIMPAIHSQHAWIIAQQSLSPLVQVMRTPSSVISHLHMPIIRLQQHTVMPFIITQHEHMPPVSIVHRFWSMLADILSSQEQVIFIPPLHFSIFIVQRGTIIMLGPPAIAPGAPIAPAPISGVPIPGIPIAVRPTIIAVVMGILSSGCVPNSWIGPSFGPAGAHYMAILAGNSTSEALNMVNQSSLF